MGQEVAKLLDPSGAISAMASWSDKATETVWCRTTDGRNCRRLPAIVSTSSRDLGGG